MDKKRKKKVSNKDSTEKCRSERESLEYERRPVEIDMRRKEYMERKGGS